MNTPLTNPDKIKILKDVLTIMNLKHYEKNYDFCMCELIYTIIHTYNFEQHLLSEIQIIFNLIKYDIDNYGIHKVWFPLNKQGAEKRISIIKELITEFEQLT